MNQSSGYTVGTLKPGDQLAIAWNRGFLTDDSCDQIYLLDDTGKLRQITENDSYSHMTAVWSPDGRNLMVSETYSWANWVYLAGEDGSNLREITPDNGYMSALMWSPDSRYLLCLEPETHETNVIIASVRWLHYHLYDTTTDHYRLLNHLKLDWIIDYVWLRDENALLVALGQRNEPGSMLLQKYHFDTDGMTTLNADYLRGITRLKFSPDGSQIAFTRQDKFNHRHREVLYAARLDGSNQRQLTQLHKYNVDGDLVWSPDGRKLALTDMKPDDYGYGYSLYVIDAD
ncbi:MAG TPA: hypothetical protein VHL11_22115, partial [Phototrophicaceae bacterium]|nr:hypothetical protein [Phototrophicaceae bacterium]